MKYWREIRNIYLWIWILVDFIVKLHFVLSLGGIKLSRRMKEELMFVFFLSKDIRELFNQSWGAGVGAGCFWLLGNQEPELLGIKVRSRCR